VKRERGRRGKKRVCVFCVDKIAGIDYKDVPRLISGNCARHQRMLTLSIKRARNIALIPFTTE